MSSEHEQTIQDEWYEVFLNNYKDKLVFIELKSGRKYEGLKLKSIDRKGSPIRFLNFENIRDNKIVCFVASEIKRIEEIN